MKTLENSRKIAKAALLAGGLFAMPATAMSGMAAAASLYEEVARDERLTLFAGAVKQAGMASMLNQEGNFILFVPSDRAMANEGSDFLLKGVLLTPSNAERLKDLVSYHIVPADGLGDDATHLATMRGIPLHISRYGEARMVNGWVAVTERRQADNGIIYVVDRLLLPTSPDLN